MADVILREMLGPVVFGWEHVIVVASDVQSLPEQFRGLLAQKEYTDPRSLRFMRAFGIVQSGLRVAEAVSDRRTPSHIERSRRGACLLVAARDDAAFLGIGNHREARVGIENGGREPLEFRVERGVDASHNRCAIAALIAARVTVPSWRLPMVGCDVCAIPGASLALGAFDDRRFRCFDACKREDGGR